MLHTSHRKEVYVDDGTGNLYPQVRPREYATSLDKFWAFFLVNQDNNP